MAEFDWKDIYFKKKISEGDQSAFKIIFDAKYPELCYFARKIVHSNEEAEDIVIDVFTKFWQRRESIEQIKDLASFLYTSVKNASLNHLRSQQRIPKIIEDLGAATYSMAEILEDEEIYARLLNEVYTNIESLPSQCKTIFKLLYFEGKSTQEIADKLQISVQSVRNQKTRAIQLLKVKLDTRHLLSISLIQVILDHLQSK